MKTYFGIDLYNKLNADSKALPNVEGYWRKKEIDNDPLPWPVSFEVQGYDADYFIQALTEIEGKESCKRVVYRGISQHRWNGAATPMGNCEFEYEGWRWPGGFKSYLALNVPPSQAFYKFITGKELHTLPTYGRGHISN